MSFTKKQKETTLFSKFYFQNTYFHHFLYMFWAQQRHSKNCLLSKYKQNINNNRFHSQIFYKNTESPNTNSQNETEFSKERNQM